MMFQVIESMITGRDSTFDVVHWFQDCRADQPNGKQLPELAMTVIMQHFVQLPRLARRVRSSGEDPDNSITVLETALLAKSLYDDPVFVSVGAYVARITAKTESNVNCVSPLPGIAQSKFESMSDLILAVFYHTCQLLLCRLIQKISTVSQVAEALRRDCKAAERQEIEAAESIARCPGYALDRIPGPARDLFTMLIHTPIRLSYHTWDKMLKCQPVPSDDRLGTTTGTSQALQATDIKIWCVGISNRVHELWGSPNASEDMLRLVSGVFAGGSLLPWMLKRAEPAYLSARSNGARQVG
jgi:hypothetical protein